LLEDRALRVVRVAFCFVLLGRGEPQRHEASVCSAALGELALGQVALGRQRPRGAQHRPQPWLCLAIEP
jgi:hypothetical protein